MSDLLGGSIAIAFGLACLAGCGYTSFRSIRRLRYHHRTVATVVRLWINDDDSYFPVLEFHTTTGQRQRAISPFGGGSKDWVVGQRVPITYDPEMPRRAEIKTFGPLWLFPIALGCFGIGSVWLGITTGINVYRSLG